MLKMPNCAKNFAICLQRHQVHYRSIKAQLSKEITWDINEPFNTFKGRLNLRQMILAIKLTAETTRGNRIFQSVDYIADCSKVYFPLTKKMGPGGEGIIFQYYQSMEQEASIMFQGLGVYLSHVYGENPIKNKFGMNHWAECHKWVWDPENKVFIPDKRRVAELIQLDSNADIIGKEAQLLQPTDNGNQTTVANHMMSQQEQDLIQILRNPDLDPISALDVPVRETVDTVQVNPDTASATSRLTFDNYARSTSTRMASNRASSVGSSSTVSSLKTSTLRKAIDPKLSKEENQARVKRLAQLHMDRL